MLRQSGPAGSQPEFHFALYRSKTIANAVPGRKNVAVKQPIHSTYVLR